MNVLQSARTSSSTAVQFTEENHRLRVQQSDAAGIMLLSEEKSVHHSAAPAASTINQESHCRPPSSPVTCDVFQLAPFKAAAKESKMAFSGSSFSHKSADTCDVFLQAPFGKRTDHARAVTSNARIFTRDAQQMPPFKQCHLLPAASPPGVQAPYVHVETPLLQQPVAVHRVVSRIGQQAAVGSVAVGPLHAWTIGGRALEDPFTAAPFQPRCSQGKP